MKNAAAPAYLGCVRVRDSDPGAPSTTKNCPECGALLWVSYASLADHPFAIPVCLRHFPPGSVLERPGPETTAAVIRYIEDRID